jgi:vitamin B12/bleomycin/antimicrobial peptide transport system ATP-binding/permease protein
MAVPILVAAPRYIVGAISLGTLMQSVQAFGHLVSALSWPANNMEGIATWRASVERVLGLVKDLDDLELDISCLDANQICVLQTTNSTVKLDKLTLHNVQAVAISSTISDEIKAVEHVLIVGDTHAGAKLFQVIAGLWPWGTGQVEIPADEPQFFMPPRPYLPTVSLLEAICYPKSAEAFKRPDVEKWLKKLGIKELIKQLDQVQSWEKQLSREQQQRIGLLRVLLYCYGLIILDTV